MKRLLLFLLIIPCVVNAHGNNILMQHDLPESRLISWSETNDMGRPYTYMITSKDVNNTVAASGTMKTISSPGRYYLAEDLHITASYYNTTCFKITSSNVIFDLRGHTIMGSTSEGQGIVALQVGDGLVQVSNVMVCNGNIGSFHGVGIKTSFANNVLFKNMHVEDCTKEGMNLSSTDDMLLDNVTVTRCNGSHTSATYGATGLYAASCNRLLIKNSKFDGNQASNAKEAYGVYISGCSHAILDSCQTMQNQAGVPSSGDLQAYGFYLTSSNHIVMKHCISACSTTSTGTAYGVYLSSCNGMHMEDCHIDGTQASGAHAYGAYFDNCSGAEVTNCMVSRSNGDESAYGFYLDSSTYNYFMNCVSHNHETTSSVMTTTVAGYFSTNGKGNSFKNCLAFGNRGYESASNGNSNATGFYLHGTEKYSNILHCESRSNNGEVGFGYGIFLDGATYCTIRGNHIFNNVGAANGYGIRDDASSSVSVFFENFAYNNGTSNGLVFNNYDVKLSPGDSTNDFPVHTAFLTDFRPLKDQAPYDNVELIERADTDDL